MEDGQWTMVEGRRRRKRQKKSNSSISSEDSVVSTPELKHKGNPFDSLSETPASASLGETADIIAQANSSLAEDSGRKILKARKMTTGVDQALLQAIGDIVDQKLEEKLDLKLKKAVETIQASFVTSLSTLETRVKKVEDDNKRLREEIENLSMGEGADATTLARTVEPVVERTVEPVVERVLDAKQVLTRPEFDYDRTLAVTGIYEMPGENEMEIAEKLVHEGLNLPNTKVVRAKRLPFNQRTRKPGIFKIELESTEKKMEALSQTGRLSSYRALGNRVVVRSSQTYEHRQMINNWRTFLYEEGLENRYAVTKGGNLIKNTWNQQDQQQQGRPGQQQLFQQQQTDQVNQFQPQLQAPSYASVVQPPAQAQSQSTPLSFTQNTTLTRSQQQPPTTSQPQQHAPNYGVPPPSTAQTAAFNFTGRNVQNSVQNLATTQPNLGVMTNQFKFGVGNPLSTQTSRSAAPGY